MSSTTPCPRCKDFLRFDLDGTGRIKEVCPHCDEGRPHSRARWFARWQEEQALCVPPPTARPDLPPRTCEICQGTFQPTGERNVYCSAPCSAEGDRRANRERYLTRKQRPKREERRCQYEGCNEPCKVKWCIPHGEVMRHVHNRVFARERHARLRAAKRAQRQSVA